MSQHEPLFCDSMQITDGSAQMHSRVWHFHSSSYFMSCISENHLRFAYMIHFPFLVIKKKRLYLQSSLLLARKSQEKTFGLFIPFSSPLHCNEDNTEM